MGKPENTVTLFPRSDGRTQRDFLAVLASGYGVTVLGAVRGALVVRTPFAMGASWWTIADNGGELNVERINDPESLRSVASFEYRVRIDGSTMAYRVAMVLRGESIDYTYRCDDMAAAFIGEAANG